MKIVNSFTRKPHPNQIATYFGLSSLVIVYFLITFPLSNNLCKIIGGILELILGLTILISGYMVSKTDPTDSIVKAMLKAKHEGKAYIPPIQQFYCASDDSYTTQFSKHCFICNRCTEEYDHHCSWLNNDIGKANYKSFFVFISALLFFLVVYIALAIKLTVEFSVDPTLLQNDVWIYQNKVGHIKFAMILLWISLVASMGILIFDLSLVFLHLFLIKKGITTFQYMALVEQKKGYEREMELAKKALGDKERTFFDFVLFLGRKIKNLNRTSKTSSDTTADLECQNLNSSEFKLKPEKCQDHEQLERLVVEQQRKGKYAD